MNTNPTEIGLRIKKARKAAKMSQTVLGTYLNKTLRTIQKYESGEIEPSIATINEIAKVLNVSSAELIGYEKNLPFAPRSNDNTDSLRTAATLKHLHGGPCYQRENVAM